MTDHSDLMGAGAPAAIVEPKKPRGRPRKNPPVAPPAMAAAPATQNVTAAAEHATVTAAASAETRPTETDAAASPISGGLIATDTDVTQALVDKATGVILEPPDPKVAAELERLDKEAADRKAVEALMGDVPVEAAPVSTAYAAAQAQRITIVGQAKREYNYQRLLRAGKKL